MIRDNVNIPVEKMNLSFAGCGFLGIYHVGVASCFREYLPEIVRNKFSGASVGALVATAMALDCSLAESTSDLLKVAIKARSRALGPFHPTFDVTKILYDALVKALPHDAHKKVSGRLFISVTRVSDGKNKIISHFDSKDDLIQAIQCSCFIPCWSGVLPPKFHGVAYMDGGFSDNLPILNDYTVTVAPFAGESDICPQENTFNYMQIQLSNTSFSISPGNLYRITRILFPPHPEEMSKMCLQGFNDALKFLQRTNKISCLRCVAIQSSFLLAESNESEPDELIDTVVVEEDEEDEEMEEEAKEEPPMQQKETLSEEVDQSNDRYETDLIYDDSSECTSCREMIDLHSLPDPVAKAIQEAIDSVNKGLINWIYKHRPVRVLSLLTIPFTLPFDLALIFAIKSLRMIPVVTNEFKTSLFNIIAFLLKKDKFGKKKATTRFSCQLAITEFGGKPISSDSGPSPAKISKPCKRKESVFNIESPYTRRKISTHDNSRLSPSNSRLEKSETLLSASSTSDLRSRLREETKAKRNSYAGKEFSYSTSNLSRSASCQRERRKTVAGLFNSKSNSANCNLHNPQRMNFGFTVDLPVDRLPSGSRKNSTRRRCTGVEMDESYEASTTNIPSNNQNSPNDVLLTVLQSLGDGIDPQEIDLDAKEVTNKALSIEKEYFERFANSELGGVAKNTEALDKIMDVASNNHALMAFYYLDEKKRVKVTEIFSIPDACERDKVDDDVDDGIEIVDDDFRTRNEANTSRCCDNFIENDNQSIDENNQSDEISEWVHFHGTDVDELSSLQVMSIRSQSRNDFTSNNSKSNNNNLLG